MTDTGKFGRLTLPEPFQATLEDDESSCPVLVVLTGPQLGQRIRLEAAALIGRDPESDLMLNGDGVGWHHARIHKGEHGWMVTDLEAKGSTQIEGMRVHQFLLSPDDQLILGGTVLRFEVHGRIEQAYDEKVLERLNKDELTGLLARRRFDQDLSAMLAAAIRSKLPLSVITLDIDRLKPINDVHGHLVGARVIAQVGALVGREVGGQGVCCRLGGDEFAVALNGPLASAQALAERLRWAVAQMVATHEGERLRVRVSAGLASLGLHGRTPNRLLRAADEALYAAKHAGGDQVMSPA